MIEALQSPCPLRLILDTNGDAIIPTGSTEMTCSDKSPRVPITLARLLRDAHIRRTLEAEREATQRWIERLDHGLANDEIIPKHVIHQRLLNRR